MDIQEFLNKYEAVRNLNSESFKADWKSLKDAIKNDDSTMNLLMEQLVESRYSFSLIKDLFNSDPNNEKIKNNPDLFKWAAAFHMDSTINFFYKNLNIKNEEGAITAAIINGRLDNLKSLEKLGLNIFTENHFCQVMNRHISIRESNIFEYYIENIDKLEITEYSKKILQENKGIINKHPEIENILNIKLLNNKLNKDLDSKQSKPSPKMKI